MFVRTESNARSEIHKDEVPTDLMRTEDVPGSTPSLEDYSKDQSAQGDANGTLKSATWKAKFSGRGCSFWQCYYSLLGYTHFSPQASSSSQGTMQEKDCVDKVLEKDCVGKVPR